MDLQWKAITKSLLLGRLEPMIMCVCRGPGARSGSFDHKRRGSWVSSPTAGWLPR